MWRCTELKPVIVRAEERRNKNTTVTIDDGTWDGRWGSSGRI